MYGGKKTVKDLDNPASGRNIITRPTRWFPMYSGYYDHAAEKAKDPMYSSACPVFYNVTDNSTAIVLDKLRDALVSWEGYPRIIVYSGTMNCLKFNCELLHHEIDHFIWLGQSKIKEVKI